MTNQHDLVKKLIPLGEYSSCVYPTGIDGSQFYFFKR